MNGEISAAPLFMWVSGLMTLLALGTTIWNMVTSGARANSKIIAEHARRIDHLEGQMEQAPSAAMLHRLELSMTRIEGELNTQNARLEPVAAIAERMQELMLQNKVKG